MAAKKRTKGLQFLNCQHVKYFILKYPIWHADKVAIGEDRPIGFGATKNICQQLQPCFFKSGSSGLRFQVPTNNILVLRQGQPVSGQASRCSSQARRVEILGLCNERQYDKQFASGGRAPE